MNFRTTAIIFGIFALLLGVWYFVVHQRGTQDTTQTETLSQRYQIDQEQVLKIHLSYRDEAFAAWTLSREADGWWITEPIKADADDAKVNTLLRDLLGKKIKRTLGNVADLSPYGLASPVISAELWTDGTSPAATLLVGDKTVNYSAYLKEADVSSIHTVESSILDDLAKSPSDLRERRLFVVEKDSIRTLDLSEPDQPAISLERMDDAWQIIQPLNAPADDVTVKEILDALSSLKAQTFEAEGIANPGAYGLPGLTLDIGLADQHLALHIGSDIPGTTRVYASLEGSDTVYGIDAGVRDKLSRNVFELRDKRVVDFQRTDVQRFEIEHDQKRLVCEKTADGDWSIRRPIELKAEPAVVDDFLFQLDSLKAIEFVDEAPSNLTPYGLQPPKIVVRVFAEGQNIPSVITFGNGKGEHVYAKGERKTVYLVPRDIVTLMSEGAAAFRARTFWSFETSDVTRFGILYGSTHIEAAKQGTTWRLTSPIQERANVEAVQNLLGKIAPLRVQRYMGKSDRISFVQPQLMLTLALADGTAHALLLGDSAGDDLIYAQGDSDEMILLLPESLLGSLQKTVDDLREKTS